MACKGSINAQTVRYRCAGTDVNAWAHACDISCHGLRQPSTAATAQNNSSSQTRAQKHACSSTDSPGPWIKPQGPHRPGGLAHLDAVVDDEQGHDGKDHGWGGEDDEPKAPGHCENAVQEAQGGLGQGHVHCRTGTWSQLVPDSSACWLEIKRHPVSSCAEGGCKAEVHPQRHKSPVCLLGSLLVCQPRIVTEINIVEGPAAAAVSNLACSMLNHTRTGLNIEPPAGAWDGSQQDRMTTSAPGNMLGVQLRMQPCSLAPQLTSTQG